MLRKMLYAGSWYPKEEKELGKLVNTEGCGNAVSAILPHAGLYYSAPLISSFFSSISPCIRKCIILAPSHYYALKPDEIISSSFKESETPFGNIRTFEFPIESKIVDTVIEREHAIEMFLPFIKKKGLDASYAVISSISSFESAKKIALSLLDATDDETAIIASSDFTHYGSRFCYTPFEEENDPYSLVIKHDLTVASLLAKGDVENVFPYQKRSTICGIAPAMILSEMMRKKGIKGEVGNHYTSYDITKDDKTTFVSYVNVIYERKSDG